MRQYLLSIKISKVQEKTMVLPEENEMRFEGLGAEIACIKQKADRGLRRSCCLVAVVALLSPTAYACLGIRNCIPLSIPIKNTSGEKFLSAEAKQARKTADLILRMDISRLLDDRGYESPEAFAPVAEKYLLVSPAEWQQQVAARPDAGSKVCNQAELAAWTIDADGILVKYRLRVAARIQGAWNPGRLQVAESGVQQEVSYKLQKVGGKWKVKDKEMSPNWDMLAISESKSRARWIFIRPRATEEWSSWAKAIYEQLEQAEAKYCK